jgi:hypothetical protein
MKISVIVAALLLFITAQSTALPRFASRMGLACSSCHVNPSGGGMRNTFGAASYGREDLPVPTWQDGYELDGFSTQLTPFVSIGADFRMLYFSQQTGPSTSRNSFFQMQSDLYLSLQLAKKTYIYLNRGNAGRFEAFGLAGVLPANGYIKAGWFVPNFGLRSDDHNIFTREKTLFAFNGGQDAGIEAGIFPGIFAFTASVTNGATADRDNNGFKALLGRGEVRTEFVGNKVRVGGTYYNNAHSAGVTTLQGIHGMATLGENLTVLGEFVKRREYVNAAGRKTLSSIFYFEADYVITQGVDLKAGYEFYDPDTRYATGTESRIVLGVEFFPLPGVELRPMYVLRNEKPTDSSNNQFLALLHLYL